MSSSPHFQRKSVDLPAIPQSLPWSDLTRKYVVLRIPHFSSLPYACAWRRRTVRYSPSPFHRSTTASAGTGVRASATARHFGPGGASTGTSVLGAAPVVSQQPYLLTHEQGLIGFAGVPLMWEQPPLPHVASTGHWATDTLANSMSGRTARNRKHRKVLPVSCFQALARFPRKSPNSGENGDPCVSLDVFWHDRQGSEEAICGRHSPGMMYARCRLHVM